MSIKGQGHSMTLAKGHSDFKIKPCTHWSFATKLHMKAYGITGMKIYTNYLGGAAVV